MPWPIPDMAAPPEIERPSVGRWLGVGILVAMGVAMAVLFNWPSDESVGSGWFWCCAVGFPLLGGGLVFAWRWHAYEVKAEERRLWLRERDRTLDRWRIWGRQYVSIVAVAYILPGNLSALHLTGVEATGRASPGRPYNLNKPLSLEVDAVKTQSERLSATYIRLLTNLRDSLPAFPSPTRVHLLGASKADALRAWKTACETAYHDHAPLSVEHGPLSARPDIDGEWYDRTPEEAHLVVAVSMGESEKSEFAAAVLFSAANAAQKGNGEAARLFRPMNGPADAVRGDLAAMLESGQAAPGDLGHAWLCNMDDKAAARLMAAAHQLELFLGGEEMPGETRLDILLGPQPQGAFWLALALAAQTGMTANEAGLLARSDGDLHLQIVSGRGLNGEAA